MRGARIQALVVDDPEARGIAYTIVGGSLGQRGAQVRALLAAAA